MTEKPNENQQPEITQEINESNEPVSENTGNPENKTEPTETPQDEEPATIDSTEEQPEAVNEPVEKEMNEPEETTTETTPADNPPEEPQTEPSLTETGEETSQPEAEKTEEKEPEPEPEALEVDAESTGKPQDSAHDDFDWDQADTKIDEYDPNQRAELEKMYEKTMTTVTDGEITKGLVVGITDTDVVLNIGFKSDGMVPLSEFRDMPDLKIGDEVEVYVVSKEDKRGQLVLSRKNAKILRAWESIVDAYNNDKVVTGTVISKTKGGLIVDVLGLETFLPGSQIDVKPILDYDAFVGKTMEFKVVKINEAIKNAVVSHKALIESDLEEQRYEIISKLEKGQVLEGTVKNITDFGAFIDLGGVDGLLYITDISWGRINHPSEVLELNQRINVVVLDFDDDKKRISLGLKQLQPHPWDTLDESITEGSKVKGKIVNIEDYGAFLEIVPGVEGLIHVSEVSWSNHPINARDYFKLGDEYEAVVVTIDREERKMSLSIKQLTEDPWLHVEEKYPVGSRHTGIVKNITPYGVFVEFDDFFGGMVHISDLSWIKRYNHPSEVTKMGEEMEVVVIGIDKENRKLNLSHKHIEEDPWDTFETVFPVGSVHEGTVIKKDEKGGLVQLPYGLEGFLPKKHMKKADGNTVEVDEILPFMILEFDRNDKRIIVSHTRVVSEEMEEEKRKEKRSKSKHRKETESTITRINRKTEKSTLGDLGVLEELKKELEKEEKKGTRKKSPKKESKAEDKAKDVKEAAPEEETVEKPDENKKDGGDKA